MQDFEHLKSVLSKFAEETERRAFLYRAQSTDEEPEATGAFIVIGRENGRRFMSIHGLQGELPANIKITDEQVLVSPPGDPDKWEPFDDEDADALRAFSVLDPRILGEVLEDAEFESVSDDEIVATGKFSLASLRGLPDEFVEWLQADTLDHEVELRLKGEQVVEISQQDLYPRQSDRISERFEN